MSKFTPPPIIELEVMQLPHARGLPLPSYPHELAGGLDLVAAIAPGWPPITIAPGERAAIPTGLVIAMPPGVGAQIRPRTGLALRHGITVLNTPGTVDVDYRGEVQVVLVNFGKEPVTIERGARIAQLVLTPVLHAVVRKVSQ
jgi:dUTP pyrophosphatase